MEPDALFHVALKVDDLDESVAFYREWFDAELLERRGGDGERESTGVEYAALAVADKRVYLFDAAPYEAAGLVEEIPPGFLHFGLVVGDVEAAHRELADEGVEFLMEPTDVGDLKVAFLTDPAGVRVELVEHA